MVLQANGNCKISGTILFLHRKMVTIADENPLLGFSNGLFYHSQLLQLWSVTLARMQFAQEILQPVMRIPQRLSLKVRECRYPLDS
jgi:hypothetical protein